MTAFLIGLIIGAALGAVGTYYLIKYWIKAGV